MSSVLVLLLALGVPVTEQTPPELEGIAIIEKLGAKAALDTPLTTSDGHKTTLGALLRPQQPVLLTLGYYGCPMLCTLVLNGVVDGLKGLGFTAGVDYRVVSVSIDARETAENAAAKKKSYLEALHQPSFDHTAWQFTVGADTDVRRLADSVGFQYRWDDASNQFAHAAGIFILSPDGTLSRVLYGIDYPSRDLRLALTEASQGKLGGVVDKLLLYCFHYDPLGRKYALYARNVMALGGAFTVLALGLMLMIFFRTERRGEQQGAML